MVCLNLSTGRLVIFGSQPPPEIITSLHVLPAEFDPYQTGLEGKVAISYELDREAQVGVEILSGGSVVKTLTSGETKSAGSHSLDWCGIIDFSEVVRLEGDQGVLIAPDGEYTVRVTAQEVSDPSVTDSKETTVKVKSAW